jgi:hypothetical protein
MSGLLLVVVGLILALAGARSLRWAFFAAGLGAGWLVATVVGASAGSALLWAAGGRSLHSCLPSSRPASLSSWWAHSLAPWSARAFSS